MEFAFEVVFKGFVDSELNSHIAIEKRTKKENECRQLLCFFISQVAAARPSKPAGPDEVYIPETVYSTFKPHMMDQQLIKQQLVKKKERAVRPGCSLQFRRRLSLELTGRSLV